MAENKKSNEKRLIDADEVIELINGLESLPWEEETEELVNSLTTVDAVEVVHGYWIDSTTVDHMGRIIEHGIDCSVCDSVFKDDSREVVKRWKNRFKVCPFCGAVMDGGNEDA